MAQRTVQLGAIGIWTSQLDNFPAARAQEAVAELEELGFGALWFGEATGREALTSAGLLLAGTKRIVIATGIANIYGRDPVTMAAAQKTLAEAYPNRFLLRSEEHTSELQSHSDLVCRLLLEKKKTLLKYIAVRSQHTD